VPRFSDYANLRPLLLEVANSISALGYGGMIAKLKDAANYVAKNGIADKEERKTFY